MPVSDGYLIGQLTSAEASGAYPGQSGAENYRAIQAALTAAADGGTVSLTRPGTYEIDDTLVIEPNSKFALGEGVSIKMQGGINKSLLRNSAMYATPSAVTLTWTSGINLQINWTNHGLVVGDYVSLGNITPAAFNGVYRVKTVTDANTLQVNLYRDPTFIGRISVTNGSATITFQYAVPWTLAGYSVVVSGNAAVYTISAHTAQQATATITPVYAETTSTNFTRQFRCTKAPVAVSGTIQARKADTNIVVSGGMWDYNYTGGNSITTQNTDRHGFVLGHLADCTFKEFDFIDGNKYVVSVGAAAHVYFRKKAFINAGRDLRHLVSFFRVN